MELPYSWPTVLLLAVQATLVLIPGAGLPLFIQRLTEQQWFLAVPIVVASMIGLLAVLPDAAIVLTWACAVGVPLAAIVAPGWAVHWSRPWFSIFVLPLIVLAFVTDKSIGELAATSLSALSTVPLARVFVGVVGAVSRDAEGTWSYKRERLILLRTVIVMLAALDAVLVLPELVTNSYDNLYNTSGTIPIPGPGGGNGSWTYRLPQFQVLSFHGAYMGFGDVFWASALGATFAAEGCKGQIRLFAALVTLTVSLLFDLLFCVFVALPALVPLAATVLIFCDWPEFNERLRRINIPCARNRVEYAVGQPLNVGEIESQ